MKFQKTISVLCVFVLFLQLFGPQFARAANSTGASDTGEVITTAESLSETGAEAGDTVDDTVIANDALSGSEEKTETNDATAETNDATAETNDATAETNDAMSVTSEDKTLTSGGGLLETHGNNMASVSTLSSNSIPQGSTITPTVRTKEKEGSDWKTNYYVGEVVASNWLMETSGVSLAIPGGKVRITIPKLHVDVSGNEYLAGGKRHPIISKTTLSNSLEISEDSDNWYFVSHYDTIKGGMVDGSPIIFQMNQQTTPANFETPIKMEVLNNQDEVLAETTTTYVAKLRDITVHQEMCYNDCRFTFHKHGWYGHWPAWQYDGSDKRADETLVPGQLGMIAYIDYYNVNNITHTPSNGHNAKYTMGFTSNGSVGTRFPTAMKVINKLPDGARMAGQANAEGKYVYDGFAWTYDQATNTATYEGSPDSHGKVHIQINYPNLPYDTIHENHVTIIANPGSAGEQEFPPQSVFVKWTPRYHVVEPGSFFKQGNKNADNDPYNRAILYYTGVDSDRIDESFFLLNVKDSTHGDKDEKVYVYEVEDHGLDERLYYGVITRVDGDTALDPEYSIYGIRDDGSEDKLSDKLVMNQKMDIGDVDGNYKKIKIVFDNPVELHNNGFVFKVHTFVKPGIWHDGDLITQGDMHNSMNVKWHTSKDTTPKTTTYRSSLKYRPEYVWLDTYLSSSTSWQTVEPDQEVQLQMGIVVGKWKHNSIVKGMSPHRSGGYDELSVKDVKILAPLPKGLEYVPGSVEVVRNINGNDLEPVIIDNYKNTGKKALIFNLGDLSLYNHYGDGAHESGTSPTLINNNFKYKLRVTNQMPATVQFPHHFYWTDPNENIKLHDENDRDTQDFDDDGNTQERFFVTPRTSLKTETPTIFAHHFDGRIHTFRYGDAYKPKMRFRIGANTYGAGKLPHTDGSNSKLKNVKMISLLPAGVIYATGSMVASVKNINGDSLEPVIIENFKGTGKTALVFSLGDLQYHNDYFIVPNANGQNVHQDLSYSVDFGANVSDGDFRVEHYAIWDNNNVSDINGGHHYSDALDLDGDSNLNERFVRMDDTIIKFIAPYSVQLTNEITDTDKANAVFSSLARLDRDKEFLYKVSVFNNNLNTMNGLSVLTTLPKVGDKSIMPYQNGYVSRGSEFTVQITKSIESLPENQPLLQKWDVLYSTDEVVESYDQNIAKNWLKAEDITDFSAVTMVRFVQKPNTLLNSKENYNFYLPAKPVVGSEIDPLSKAVLSSVISIRGNKPEEANSTVLELIDKYKVDGKVFADLNKDGSFEGDDGLSDYEILLYHANGTPVLDATGEQLKATTNKDGMFVLEVLERGKYYIETVKKNPNDTVSPLYEDQGVRIVGNGGNDAIVDANDVTGLKVRSEVFELNPFTVSNRKNVFEKPSSLVATRNIGFVVNDGRIKVYKVDNLDPKKFLEGAVFQIKHGADIMDTITTDHEGVAISRLLPFGNYTVVEIKAPQGYNGQSTTTLELDGAIHEVTIVNQRIGAGIGGGGYQTTDSLPYAPTKPGVVDVIKSPNTPISDSVPAPFRPLPLRPRPSVTIVAPVQDHGFKKYPTRLPKTGVAGTEEIVKKVGIVRKEARQGIVTSLPNKATFKLAGSSEQDLNYWLQVLPQQDRFAPQYIVLPAQGLIMPINTVQHDSKAYTRFINGHNEDFHQYLHNGAVQLPATTLHTYGQQGNKVIVGHSSYWEKAQGRYKTHFQKIIGLSQNEEVWIYKKNAQGTYERFVYSVQASYNTTPTDVSVLKPTLADQITLITCTPIGGVSGRWIVKAIRKEG